MAKTRPYSDNYFMWQDGRNLFLSKKWSQVEHFLKEQIELGVLFTESKSIFGTTRFFTADHKISVQRYEKRGGAERPPTRWYVLKDGVDIGRENNFYFCYTSALSYLYIYMKNNG